MNTLYHMICVNHKASRRRTGPGVQGTPEVFTFFTFFTNYVHDSATPTPFHLLLADTPHPIHQAHTPAPLVPSSCPPQLGACFSCSSSSLSCPSQQTCCCLLSL